MSILDGAENALVIGRAFLEDPNLPEVTGLIMRLRQIEAETPSPGGAPNGIGLKYAVEPLKLYVAIRERPIIGVALIAGLLSIPFIIGHFHGRSRRR